MYEMEGRKAMNIITPTHGIWMNVAEDRVDFAGETPTQEEKAAAYDAFQATAGSWSCEGKRCTFTRLFDKQMELAGTSFGFEYEVEGNLCRYWIIQPDGSRGPEGLARKLADWDAPSNCNAYTGVWEHHDIGGIYIQSGNYGAFINILDPTYHPEGGDLTTTSEKAKAFDAYKAAFYIAHCDEKGMVDNVLMLSDPTFLQDQVWRVAPLEWKDGYSWFYLQDADGKKMEPGYRMTRMDAGEGPFSVPHRALQDKYNAVISQMTGAFLSNVKLAKDRGESPYEHGKKIGDIFKYSWNREAGVNGLLWGTLYNFANFSTHYEDLVIRDQSEDGITISWASSWDRIFANGPHDGVTLEEYDAFLDGAMHQIADYLGATYSQHRDDEGLLWVEIGKKE